MNSVLYRTETKLLEDFSSLLIFELYDFWEKENLKDTSFLNILKKDMKQM